VCYSGMKEHPTSLVSAVKLAVPTKTAYAVLEPNSCLLHYKAIVQENSQQCQMLTIQTTNVYFKFIQGFLWIVILRVVSQC